MRFNVFHCEFHRVSLTTLVERIIPSDWVSGHVWSSGRLFLGGWIPILLTFKRLRRWGSRLGSNTWDQALNTMDFHIQSVRWIHNSFEDMVPSCTTVFLILPFCILIFSQCLNSLQDFFYHCHAIIRLEKNYFIKDVLLESLGFTI